MIARLLISPSLENRKQEIDNFLVLHIGSVTVNHPDILYFPASSKLGIVDARKIKDHFSLKPYSAKGRTVVLEDATTLTVDAQNALLKTLEELPEEGIIILGADSDAKFLPTVLSRVQVIRLQGTVDSSQKDCAEAIEKLLTSSIVDRF